MCCRRRRAARQAWLEQRALAGGPRGCGGGPRHFGPGPGGPPFRPPWASGGGYGGGGGGGPPFGRWRAIPQDNVPQDPFRDPPAAPRNDPATRDPEKGGALEMNVKDVEKSTPAPVPAPVPEGDSKRVSFMSGPFSRWRESVRSGGGDVRRSSSNATLPPRYTSGVPEAPPYWSGEQAGDRRSLPPNYDVAIKN
ncbi:hypothetical protein HER10_EVM0003519 [Colletotrichum scovillei]|uniref:uncharacterized protein n=1 Tax=Colletotrichum scovillei TaxID=1209932 RepID=UPI0015C2F150|nr:uncharacterized protein HER10_EVM0003519 [Colletotrichum scovillei]KAF4773705.1 hypothetical protein HER10_EVM0003519 [Colletotrichum scovillei]